MRKLWNRVSYLGLNASDINPDKRVDILANRLNALLIILLFLLFISSVSITIKQNRDLTYDVFRLLVQIAVGLLNIYLAYRGKHKLVRLILANSFLIVLILLPTFFSVISKDNFIYFPYTILAFYFVALLLINPWEETNFLVFSMLLSFFSLLFIEKLMYVFNGEKIELYEMLSDYRVFNKIVQVSMFIFITLAVFYLKNLNSLYEIELSQKNKELDRQNDELRFTMENLKTTQQQLIHTARMASIGTFSAGVAHEINNPLNYIVGGVEVLKAPVKLVRSQKEIAQEVNMLIDKINLSNSMILEGVKRVSTIVNSLMIFSAKGKSKVCLTDVNAILKESLLLLKFKTCGAINVITDFSSDVVTMAYPDKLQLVFINVLENAIYATLNSLQSDKYIELYTQVAGSGTIQIEIFNCGDNIPPDSLEHIFDPFFTTKEPGDGTGLGLSIAFSLIQEHQGAIKAQNMGNGVKIIIKIPIKRP